MYDNACHAQDYVLNREPKWAKHTVFVVDKLHWPNHKACSPSFNVRLYNVLSQLNSQLAEQKVRKAGTGRLILSWVEKHLSPLAERQARHPQEPRSLHVTGALHGLRALLPLHVREAAIIPS